MRLFAWGQLLFVIACVGYSTYALFIGDFEQAFLPYPILILYYIIFARRKALRDDEGESKKQERENS